MSVTFLDDIKSIYTHGGKFHADEVCACAFLRVASGRNLPITRGEDDIFVGHVIGISDTLAFDGKTFEDHVRMCESIGKKPG